ncbi:hypothetical protein QBC39DRAFT_351698 [Podospora conica]|nr:hypothetical protein QBC39DRAFT_351698 [Schizothecium conicum]
MFHWEDSVCLLCRRGRRVARSFQHVGRGKDGWRRTVRSLFAKGDWSSSHGCGGENPVHIFHAKPDRHAPGLGTVTQIAPLFLSNKVPRPKDFELCPMNSSSHSTHPDIHTRPNPTARARRNLNLSPGDPYKPRGAHHGLPSAWISIALSLFLPDLVPPSIRRTDVMPPPHLHPRSRMTSSLFATTLVASFFVVTLPHVLPCPAPRTVLADGEMPVPEGKRRRRKRPENPPAADGIVEFNDISETDGDKARSAKRECPVPKPKGMLAGFFGFKQAGPEDSSTSPPDR